MVARDKVEREEPGLSWSASELRDSDLLRSLMEAPRFDRLDVDPRDRLDVDPRDLMPGLRDTS